MLSPSSDGGEPPDHCYAMSVPAVEEAINHVVGMDHNYCANPSSSSATSTTSPIRHRSGSSLSEQQLQQQNAPLASPSSTIYPSQGSVDGDVGIEESLLIADASSTMTPTSSKKRKSAASASAANSSKKRGRKKKDRADVDSIDDAIANVIVNSVNAGETAMDRSLDGLPSPSVNNKKMMNALKPCDEALRVKEGVHVTAPSNQKKPSALGRNALLDDALRNLEAVAGIKTEDLNDDEDSTKTIESTTTLSADAIVANLPMFEDEDSTDTSIAVDEELEREREAASLSAEIGESVVEKSGKGGSSSSPSKKEVKEEAASSVAIASASTSKKTDAAAKPTEEEASDPNRRRSSRWSHLPKAAKRKRMKKFEAMLKAEKSKSGYLGLQVGCSGRD